MTDENQTIDIQTLTYILKHLVTAPELIEIERTLDEQGVLLSVRVDPKDMGILIGRNGVMANSIKTILRAVGKANDMNIRVQFLEPDGSLKYSALKNPSTEINPVVETSNPTVSKTEDKIDSDLDEFIIN
jgi:predicted RNA-binding protein YlqC (UPF0109 family)